jgi:hypothetical protein
MKQDGSRGAPPPPLGTEIGGGAEYRRAVRRGLGAATYAIICWVTRLSFRSFRHVIRIDLVL